MNVSVSRMEGVFYHYLLNNKSLLEQVSKESFKNQSISKCYEVAKDYVMTYGTQPKLEEFKSLCNFDDSFTEEYIDNLYSNYRIDEYNPEWLKDTIETWASWNKYLQTVQHIVKYTKRHDEDITTDNIHEIVAKARNFFNDNSIIHFDDDDGLDFFNPESHNIESLSTFTTGIRFLDICSNGGYWAGSLWVVMGAPKSGKSNILQNLCALSVTSGNNSAYITLELQDKLCVQRLGSMMLNVTPTEYKEKYNSGEVLNLLKNFKSKHLQGVGDLKIKEYPTSSATVSDIEAYLKRMEEKLSTPNKPYKFRTIFVDYINILMNQRNMKSNDNLYQKVKEIAEDLRAMAKRNGWCVITATQTNRAQFDSDDISVKDTSESSGLNATVDMMFGIIKTPEMNVSNYMYLKCLLGRIIDTYVNFQQKFNLRKTYMKIEESDEPMFFAQANPAEKSKSERRGGSYSSPSTNLIDNIGVLKSPTPSSPMPIQPPTTSAFEMASKGLTKQTSEVEDLIPTEEENHLETFVTGSGIL